MEEVGNVLSIASMCRWEVDTNCIKNKKVRDYVKSPKFFIKNSTTNTERWQLKIYPKGYEEEKGYLSLSIASLSENDIKATICILLINQCNETVVNQALKNQLFSVSSASKEWVLLEFAKETFITDLKNNILKDGKITVLCNIIIEEQKAKNQRETETQENQISKRLKVLDNFEKLFTNKEHSDVTICADGKEFYLHKCILSTHSMVFQRMFATDMKEKEQNTVVIEDIEYEVLQEFFRFMYTGKIADTEEIICKLLMAAEKYCVEELKALCEDTMCKNLSDSNAVEYLNSALSFNAKKLEVNTVNYISLRIDTFMKNPEFKTLGLQNPEILFEIMKNTIC